MAVSGLGRVKGKSLICQVVSERKTNTVGKAHGPPSTGTERLPLSLRDPEPEGQGAPAPRLHRKIVCSTRCCCSVAQSRPTLCDPVDCSAPGFPVLHISQSLLKLTSIESVVHQPSHPLWPPLRVTSALSLIVILDKGSKKDSFKSARI